MIDLDATVVIPASQTLVYACKYMTDTEIEHLGRTISRCRLLKQISGALSRRRPLNGRPIVISR
jgi:uncharacterized protein YpiB (UPF0302 family)